MPPRARNQQPSETRLDDHLDAPSTVAPGDAPADTTDPTEHASTATPDKAAAAKAGHGTVNSVVPVDRPAGSPEPAEDSKKHRIEKYDVLGPDNKPVTIEHNIDTGETKRV